MGKTNQAVQEVPGTKGTQRKPGRPKGSGQKANEVVHVRKGGVEARDHAKRAIASIANRAIKANAKVLEYLG